MQGIWSRAAVCSITAAMAVGMLQGTASAQDASAQMETQLKTIFKPTQVEMLGRNVIQQGSIVKVTKGNFLFQTNVIQPITCTATVKDGKSSPPPAICRMAMNSYGGYLPEGQRLYVTKITANVPKDTVTFEMTEAPNDPAANEPGHPSFKTSVSFIFQKSFLSKADAGQVADAVMAILPIDVPPQVAQQAGLPPPPQQEQQAPTPQPTQVDLGMTEDQVRSILGPPNEQKPAPNGKTFTYHKQITFENGKVSEIK